MITEKEHEKKLKELGINIKTKYKSFDKVLERNTDHSKVDSIPEGVCIEKDYYYKGTLIHKECVFDSRVMYSFVFANDGNMVKCPNCGSVGEVYTFTDGCPYCGTYYNIDYDMKDLGSKYYYDLTMKGNMFVLVTLLVDLLVSFFLSLIFILYTGRTFTIFDMSKVIIGTVLIGAILFYFFYYLDAAIVLPFVRSKKERLNQKQRDFWERMNKLGIDKKSFYNNLNYDLREYYYGNDNSNVIDYDILDYTSFCEKEEGEDFFVTVQLDIRIVRFLEGKIKSKVESKTYKFKKARIDKELKPGVNVIQCPHCGASMDVSKGICEYCSTKVNYLQEWYLVDTED